ncbi:MULTISPECIES: Crp/Fnr family transcriptional regulator [Trichocoleus]|uniref:Crp/Fnr family transcriptional regulator n=1 Tax=Trichocoleus desertorum GB2-A4 TaxID=2933944 RepID=A0ABV0J9Z6_9CYAN|nr:MULTISPECIES: Crp/Fnr family transcriptional regulator [unclassified Trichocoleus]MBD1862928.1 Crp/Fnr family transcriptional regulator [Trichocoleus sp. FACHB-46]MBD2124430.1 Crp/Fnr family transcriptional regulator [Trichocoleus sp. FACHB-262]
MLHSFASEAGSQPDLRQLLEELYEGRSLYPYSSGQSIRMAPQEIWIVCRGVVQLSTLYPNGDEALLGLAGPSMPFGLPLTLTHPYQATALSNVDLMRLTVADVEQSSTLTKGILRHVNRRLRQTEAILALVGHRRVKDRLCHLLLLLKQEIGLPTAEGTRLGVRLTHQHLANAIGTTRVTVTRLLGQLKEEGWLNVDRNHHIVIPSQTTL